MLDQFIIQGYSKIMIWSLLLPIVVGLATVFQGGLNRSISKDWGLASALLLNSIIVAIFSLIAWAYFKWNTTSRLATLMGDQAGAFQTYAGWYWVPGLLGFIIILGIPLSLQKVGALQTFVILIASQIVGSLIWDAMIEGRAINAARVIGAALSFFAAALVNLKG
jgi:transporter family-2 protein